MRVTSACILFSLNGYLCSTATAATDRRQAAGVVTAFLPTRLLSWVVGERKQEVRSGQINVTRSLRGERRSESWLPLTPRGCFLTASNRSRA